MDYNHYNRALNKHIRSKRHYYDELKRQNMVPQEQGDDIARRAREKQHKDYKPNDETIKFLFQAKGTMDKSGKVKLSGRQIAYMEKIGVNFKRPKDKGLEGGFG